MKPTLFFRLSHFEGVVGLSILAANTVKVGKCVGFYVNIALIKIFSGGYFSMNTLEFLTENTIYLEITIKKILLQNVSDFILRSQYTGYF